MLLLSRHIITIISCQFRIGLKTHYSNGLSILKLLSLKQMLDSDGLLEVIKSLNYLFLLLLEIFYLIASLFDQRVELITLVVNVRLNLMSFDDELIVFI
jgi:hypothetical protein